MSTVDSTKMKIQPLIRFYLACIEAEDRQALCKKLTALGVFFDNRSAEAEEALDPIALLPVMPMNTGRNRRRGLHFGRRSRS
jgi:hypothetical protein